MPAGLHKLSTQILVATMGILVFTTILGFALLARGERGRLDLEVEQRAASIAQAVAAVPQVGACLSHPAPSCAQTLQVLSNDVATRTGAAYVVVIDMSGIRYTHPDPHLVGQRVEEAIDTRDGRVHTGIDEGSTGRSANGKAPLYGPSGRMVGEVSAGIRETSVTGALRHVLPVYAAWLLCATLVGTVASWLLARHLKRATFGLELGEISRLLQEREATLHGIREAVVALDERERITVVNDEATRLTGLGADAVGRRLGEVIAPGPLQEVLTGSGTSVDQLVVTEATVLVANRMPVMIGGNRHGWVVTLRDRTEIVDLADQLNGQRNLTESLRAQQHEHANSMHVVAGLLELGEVDEALAYLLEVQGTAAEFDRTLEGQLQVPQLVGLLLGKAAEAHERGVELVVDPESHLGHHAQFARALVTVVGNLLDNALDAVAGRPAPRTVVLHVDDQDGITIVVSDNGPGVDQAAVERIFELGFTSKAGGQGGTGLALVKRTVAHLDGTIEVSPGPGATFSVWLPAGGGAEGTDG